MMIFFQRKMAILLMILLEFSRDDWLQVATDSDPTNSYAIVKPTAKWVPHQGDFWEIAEQVDILTEFLMTSWVKPADYRYTEGHAITFTPRRNQETVQGGTSRPGLAMVTCLEGVQKAGGFSAEPTAGTHLC